MMKDSIKIQVRGEFAELDCPARVWGCLTQVINNFLHGVGPVQRRYPPVFDRDREEMSRALGEMVHTNRFEIGGQKFDIVRGPDFGPVRAQVPTGMLMDLALGLRILRDILRTENEIWSRLGTSLAEADELASIIMAGVGVPPDVCEKRPAEPDLH